MKAVIHIGMPKAGSSTIQDFLALNAARLAERSVRVARFDPAFGSQYELPVSALIEAGESVTEAFAQRTLRFASLADQQAYAAAYTGFLQRHSAQWGDGDLFIASSEHLYAWLRTPAQIGALDRFLARYFESVRYIVYLRSNTEFLTSAYSEAIRRGATHDFDTHFELHVHDNPWRRLRHWLAVAGPERLIVRRLVPEHLIGGELLNDFCASTGIERDGLKAVPRVNQSLTLEQIARRRWLNRLLPVQGRSGHPSRLYRAAIALLEWRLPQPGTRLELSALQRARLRRKRQWSDRQIRAHFFPEAQRLFPED
ncbi:MAG: hypothetical protein ACK4LQ_15385 [Pararhodobacter sp.]